MKGFGKEVSDHLFRWTILDGEILHIDAVGNEVKSTIEVLGSLAAGLATVLLEQDCTLVVLIKDCILMIIALCFKKVVSPKDDWHEVVGSNNEFACSRTLGVEFLLGGGADGHSFAKRHTCSYPCVHTYSDE